VLPFSLNIQDISQLNRLIFKHFAHINLNQQFKEYLHRCHIKLAEEVAFGRAAMSLFFFADYKPLLL
jgi:hypothetical protein